MGRVEPGRRRRERHGGHLLQFHDGGPPAAAAERGRRRRGGLFRRPVQLPVVLLLVAVHPAHFPPLAAHQHVGRGGRLVGGGGRGGRGGRRRRADRRGHRGRRGGGHGRHFAVHGHDTHSRGGAGGRDAGVGARGKTRANCAENPEKPRITRSHGTRDDGGGGGGCDRALQATGRSRTLVRLAATAEHTVAAAATATASSSTVHPVETRTHVIIRIVRVRDRVVGTWYTGGGGSASCNRRRRILLHSCTHTKNALYCVYTGCPVEDSPVILS